MEAEELRVHAINLNKELESIWRDETVAPYELAGPLLLFTTAHLLHGANYIMLNFQLYSPTMCENETSTKSC